MVKRTLKTGDRISRENLGLLSPTPTPNVFNPGMVQNYPAPNTVTHIHDIVYSAAGLISRRISIVIIGQRDRECIISDGVPESGGLVIQSGMVPSGTFSTLDRLMSYIFCPPVPPKQLGIVVHCICRSIRWMASLHSLNSFHPRTAVM